jgi:aminopeptidase N
MHPFSGHSVFPCFDQPDLKSEITLFLVIPKQMEAFSCTEYTEFCQNFDENNERFNLDLLLDVNHPEGK